jgi:hypothetical protein
VNGLNAKACVCWYRSQRWVSQKSFSSVNISHTGPKKHACPSKLCEMFTMYEMFTSTVCEMFASVSKHFTHGAGKTRLSIKAVRSVNISHTRFTHTGAEKTRLSIKAVQFGKHFTHGAEKTELVHFHSIHSWGRGPHAPPTNCERSLTTDKHSGFPSSRPLVTKEAKQDRFTILTRTETEVSLDFRGLQGNSQFRTTTSPRNFPWTY